MDEGMPTDDSGLVDSPAWRQARERLGLEFLARFLAVDVAQHPDHLDSLVELGHLYTRLGQYEQGLEVDEELVRQMPLDPTVRYNLACSLALVGRTQEALEALEEAVRLGYEDADHLLADEDLASLRGEQRFLELVRELEGRRSD